MATTGVKANSFFLWLRIQATSPTASSKPSPKPNPGSISHAFIRKLLERKHATFHAYRSGGRVYHVFARKLYQAIERENLRTRKKHELEYVKTRLVALDFVLAHPPTLLSRNGGGKGRVL